MTWNEVFCNTFKALSEELGLPPAGKSLVELCRADDADFCQEVVAKGWLSEAQMAHAAERYRLGKSKKGKPIFWMIDERGIVRDGRIGDTWVSMIFKRRYPECGRYIVAKHCLFGEHLISERRATLGTDPSVQPEVADICVSPHCCTVAVVEAEKTAVILSELYPQYIWLASGGLGEVQPDKFRALRGCKVILFPDTDPDGIAYSRWSNAAEEVMRSVFWEGSPPIRVSRILEDHATEEQKRRKIDLVDFITESSA
jgi:hypothetical protein